MLVTETLRTRIQLYIYIIVQQGFVRNVTQPMHKSEFLNVSRFSWYP